MSEGIVSRPHDPVKERQIIEGMKRGRQRILEAFPSDNSGLDTSRLDNFLGRLGLRPADRIFVPAARQKDLARLVYKILRIDVGTVNGAYNPDLDLYFIIRDPEFERLNGEGATEALGAHEGAHASSDYPDIISVSMLPRDPAVYAPRVGFMTKPRPGAPISGLFFEEGFAEVLRGKYITDVLGQPKGPVDPENDVVDLRLGKRAKVALPIPAKYFHRGEKGDADLRYEAFAGSAIEHLMKHDPGLFDAMIRARRDPQALQEVRDRVNAIKPGLYDNLDTHCNSQYDFNRGYEYVLRATGSL